MTDERLVLAELLEKAGEGIAKPRPSGAAIADGERR